MRVEREFIVHAPVEYVYDFLSDLRRSPYPGWQVAECYYDDLNPGGNCFIQLERQRFFLKERFWIKAEVIEAKRPYYLKMKSETVNAVGIGSFELSEAENGTRVKWMSESKSTDVYTWIVLKLINKEIYQNRMISYWKEQIERAYKENQDVLSGFTVHQVPAETMQAIFQKEPRKQYFFLAFSILFFLFFVLSYVKNDLHIMLLLISISFLFVFLKQKPTYTFLTGILIIFDVIFDIISS